MKRNYVSDTTTFIRELLAANPQIVEQQKKNRATWWDKPQDLETTKERRESAVPQPGYVYFPLPTRDDDADESANKASTPSKPT